MTLALTAFHQIMIMFLIILVGILCFKINLIDNEMNKKLADLVLLLVNPLVIFIAYQQKFKATLLSGLLISLVLALVTHILGILISMAVIRGKKYKENIAIERFAVVYSNCGFIGIPLVNGILGSKGVFFLTAYMTIFNLLAFTHGIITISGKNDKKSILQALFSPMVVATLLGFLFFVCRIILPDLLEKPLAYIGAMNTPLALMVAGVTIAQTDLIKLIKKRRIYYISLLKLLVIPVAVLLLYHLFDIPRIVLLTTVLASACPTAATINLFSIRYDKNYLYASELFAITTILSLITIPLVMIMANVVL